MGERLRDFAPPWRRSTRDAEASARTGERARGWALGGAGLRAWRRNFAAVTGAGVFLGLVGPFGSYLNASRWMVSAYWIVSVWMGAVLFGVSLPPVVAAARRAGAPTWRALALATLVTAAPLALVCRLGAEALWPGPIGRIGWLEWYGQTLIVSAPFSVGFAWRDKLRATAGAGARGRIPADARSFLSRLSPRLGRELVALQMEDHYVRAHTRIGSTLVLVPLRQAIEELDGVAGMKVHRSWWVADAAVRGVRRDGRNLRLDLGGSLEAPVARSAVAEVRARGWLRSLD